MGKGNQSAPAGGEQRMLSLPEYADPYFRRLLQGAEEATMPYYPDDPAYGDLAGKSTYQPYEGERLARTGDYADITGSRDMIRDTTAAGVPGMSAAVTGQLAGMEGIAGLASSPTQFTPSQFGASDFSATGADPYSDFQAGRATEFGGFTEGSAPAYQGFKAGTGSAFENFQAGQADPYAGFSESQFTERETQGYNFDDARQFSGDEVQQYMDPYMQGVVDIQKREAIEDFQRGQAGRDASAIGAGAFGGSRQAVAQGMAEQNLQQRLGDIQQIGSQAAFDRAMKMFESDRAAEMDVEGRRAGELARTQDIGVSEAARVEGARAAEAARRQAAEAGELARTQGIGIDEAARVQGAQAADQARLDDIRLAEQARLQSAEAGELARTQGIGLDEAARVQSARANEAARAQGINIGEDARVQAAEAAELARTQGIGVSEAARVQGADAAEAARVQGADAAEQARIQAAQEAQRMNTADLYRQYMGAGRGLVGLGEIARGTDIQNAQLLEALGQGIRAEDQALLDMDYQDFLRQQDYPMRQYERFAGIMSGVPVQPDIYTQTYQSYNPTQQLLGAGLAGLGMYRGLT